MLPFLFLGLIAHYTVMSYLKNIGTLFFNSSDLVVDKKTTFSMALTLGKSEAFTFVQCLILIAADNSRLQF